MNATETYTPEHLNRWKLPPNYWGPRWDGYFVAPVTRNRDSSLLELSNWGSQWDALKGLRKDVPGEDVSSPCIVSENHWAVGWVEWVAIHESNAEALREADEMAAALESYPILDEESHSRAEWEAYANEWEDRWTRRGFAAACRDVFGLCDAAKDRLEDAEPDALRKAFENLVPSGEFYTPSGDGVSVRIDSARRTLNRMEAGPARAWMAKLLRAIR